MIPFVTYGLLHRRGNVVSVQAFVFHLRSFKRGVREQSLLRVIHIRYPFTLLR